MATLKERVENNAVVFFLGALVSGFVSGIGAYQAGLHLFGQKVVSENLVEQLQNEIKDLKTAEVARMGALKAATAELDALRKQAAEVTPRAPPGKSTVPRESIIHGLLDLKQQTDKDLHSLSTHGTDQVNRCNECWGWWSYGLDYSPQTQTPCVVELHSTFERFDRGTQLSNLYRMVRTDLRKVHVSAAPYNLVFTSLGEPAVYLVDRKFPVGTKFSSDPLDLPEKPTAKVEFFIDNDQSDTIERVRRELLQFATECRKLL
jgi:hypothetical protein